MSTKNSPIAALTQQANTIAATIKKAERGEKVNSSFDAKIIEARQKDRFKVGVIMDDKIVTIELLWSVIKETTEAGLAEYILGLMAEKSNALH